LEQSSKRTRREVAEKRKGHPLGAHALPARSSKRPSGKEKRGDNGGIELKRLKNGRKHQQSGAKTQFYRDFRPASIHILRKGKKKDRTSVVKIESESEKGKRKR